MDINQLKQEALELERQGRYREALAMYRHALTSLEGSPQLLRELPLYVKAGDLYQKLDKVKAGVSLYEQVGKIYAAHGSAKSVGAVCIKVVRAMPERAHVYPRMVRIMLERGHVGPARAVLALWAEHARLKTTHALLGELDEVSDDDMRAVLESVVEMAERLESSPETSSASVATEAAAEPAAPAPAPEPDRVSEPAPTPPAEPEAVDTARETEPQTEDAPAAASADEEHEAPPVEPGADDRESEAEEPEPEEDRPEAEGSAPEPVEEEPVVTSAAADDDAPSVLEAYDEPSREEPFFIEGTEPAEPSESEVEVLASAPGEDRHAAPAVEDAFSGTGARSSVRRSSIGSILVQEPTKRAQTSKRGILIGIAALIIVATLVAIPIVWLGLVPLGGADGQGSAAVPAAEPDPALPDDAAVDSARDTTLPLTLDPNPQFAAEPVATGAEDTTAGPADTAAMTPTAPVSAPVVEPPPAAAPADDAAGDPDTTPSVPTMQRPSVVPAVPAEAEPIAVQADLVMAIAGLPIESTAAVTRRGVAGREVVQTIESGEQVTVFSARSSAGPASPTVAIEGDTALGQARLNGYLVEVRGAVQTAVMWQLLDRLTARSAPGT